MAVEQQVADYIKKAKVAGQADDQSRALLIKNGWTEAEISDAFAFLNQPRPQEQPKSAGAPQIAGQPKIDDKPKIVNQPQPQAQPQVKPQPSAETTQNNMPKMRGMLHMILKLLMVVIIVATLCAIGLFAADRYNINLPWNPFAPDPATVISKMMANMKNVKSYHTNISGEISIGAQGKLVFSIDGESDITDIKNPKGGGGFSLSYLPIGSSVPLGSVNINAIAYNGVFYIKLDDFTGLSNSLYPGLDLSKIKGNWFKVDQDSVKALSAAGTGQAIDVSQANNSPLVQKIQDLALAENLLSFDKKLSDEVGVPSGSGQNTYHYLLTISKAKITDLANKILAQSSSVAGSGSLVQNMAGAFIKTATDAVGDINVEMWIGKKDYMLYQYKIDKAVDLNKIFPGANIQLNVKFNAANSNFNKPITVQAPATSQKIEDIALPLLKISKVAADMNQIGVTAQSLSGTSKSYSSLCSKGLLNGYLGVYGPTLVTLHTDIVAQGAAKPMCLSGATDYCVSTQLADGSYLCIGKNNVLGKIKCISSKTACQ